MEECTDLQRMVLELAPNSRLKHHAYDKMLSSKANW